MSGGQKGHVHISHQVAGIDSYEEDARKLEETVSIPFIETLYSPALPGGVWVVVVGSPARPCRVSRSRWLGEFLRFLLFSVVQECYGTKGIAIKQDHHLSSDGVLFSSHHLDKLRNMYSSLHEMRFILMMRKQQS
jgi:hypothetical protein